MQRIATESKETQGIHLIHANENDNVEDIFKQIGSALCNTKHSNIKITFGGDIPEKLANDILSMLENNYWIRKLDIDFKNQEQNRLKEKFLFRNELIVRSCGLYLDEVLDQILKTNHPVGAAKKIMFLKDFLLRAAHGDSSLDVIRLIKKIKGFKDELSNQTIKKALQVAIEGMHYLTRAYMENITSIFHMAAAYGLNQYISYFNQITPNWADTQDVEGAAPLHRAIQSNEPAFAEKLITKCNADIALKMSDGKTALDLAKEYGSDVVEKILESKMKNIETKDDKQDNKNEEDQELKLLYGFGEKAISDLLDKPRPSQGFAMHSLFWVPKISF